MSTVVVLQVVIGTCVVQRSRGTLRLVRVRLSHSATAQLQVQRIDRCCEYGLSEDFWVTPANIVDAILLAVSGST